MSDMTMVERIARAIDASFKETKPHLPLPPGVATYELDFWPRYLQAARDAIEAMREPTNAMWKAEGVHHNCPTCGGAGEQWPLLIDAALAPPQDGETI